MTSPTPTTSPSFDIALSRETGARRRLMVDVDRDYLNDTRRRQRDALAKRVKLKGFRKGKVPPQVVEDRYGPTLDQDTLSRLVDEAYRQGVRQHELAPVGEPEIENIDYQKGERLKFEIALEVMPEIRLERVSRFRVERPTVEVAAEEVDALIERLREQEAVLEPANRNPRQGDVVSVRIQPVSEAGEEGEARPYRFELGAGYAIDGVEEAIQTLEPGESGVFEVSYPADFDSEELAGTARTLNIELVDVKARRLPDLDDGFARGVGDFQTLEELRSAVRDDVEANKNREADQAVHERLLDSVIDANPFEVPEGLVSRYLDRVIEAPEGADPERIEEARRSITPAVERQIKRDLVLDRLIAMHDLAASEEELTARLEALGEKEGISADEARQRLAREKRLEALRHQIAVEKTFDFLVEQSSIE